jgi:D-methionine transport system ATP-binding protein
LNNIILEIRNLSKSFGEHTVLSNINLSINRGDIFGILGLSGAGKSTLIRCINGLEKFNDGEIYFYNNVVNFDREYRKNVAMIFQQFNLLDQRTVLKNVELAGELFGDPYRTEKAKHYLNLVGLSDKLDSYPSQLSGGQKQRVAIARALMNEPQILLCDEATSALDPDTTNQVLALLKELNQKLGLTIIMISHQMNVIEKICNKVAIIDNAKIVEVGETQEIFLYPKTEISKKIIYSGHINTKSDDSKLLKVIFNGELDMPLIANIVQDCNIVLSVIYADSKVVNGRVFGQLIFKMPADINDVSKLRKYLELKGINYKEVDASEFF